MLDCFDRVHAWFIEITPVLLQSGSLVYQTASFRQECGRQLFYLPPSCFVLKEVGLEDKIVEKEGITENISLTIVVPISFADIASYVVVI